MKRVVRSVFIGSILAVLAGASLTHIKAEARYALSPASRSAELNDRITTASIGGRQALGRTAYLANLDFKPSSLEIVSGFWTALAAACLVLPYGITTWATLRKPFKTRPSR